MTRPIVVIAIVPARNESGRVGATVAALETIPEVTRVIVVDDGSTDDTASEAERAGARLLRMRSNRGKGAALARGIAEAHDADVVLLADADLGASAVALSALLPPVTGGLADVTIAAPPRGDGPSGFGLVEGLARWGIERLTGRRMERPLSGQRAIRRDIFDAVGPPAAGFGVEAAFTVDALRRRYRVLEVPCDFSHARTGRTPAGFAHRAKQGFDVARALAVRWGRKG